MDLKYLLQRHRAALSNAQDAPSDEARRAHQTMVDYYAARIARATCAAPAPLRVG